MMRMINGRMVRSSMNLLNSLVTEWDTSSWRDSHVRMGETQDEINDTITNATIEDCNVGAKLIGTTFDLTNARVDGFTSFNRQLDSDSDMRCFVSGDTYLQGMSIFGKYGFRPSEIYTL